MYLAICVCVGTILISITIFPRIFFFLHMNVTQLHVMQQNVPKYLADQEKHFRLLLLYMDIGISIGGLATLGAGMVFMSCIKHTCGMFKIARSEEINIAIKVLYVRHAHTYMYTRTELCFSYIHTYI